jgi:hypothetical protein
MFVLWCLGSLTSCSSIGVSRPEGVVLIAFFFDGASPIKVPFAAYLAALASASTHLVGLAVFFPNVRRKFAMWCTAYVAVSSILLLVWIAYVVSYDMSMINLTVYSMKYYFGIQALATLICAVRALLIQADRSPKS